MTPPLDRRAFLALGLGALAWACARPGTDPADDALGTPATNGAAATSIILTAPQGLALGDTRQAFAIFRGQRPISPSDVEVRLTGPGDDDSFGVQVDKQQVLRGPGGEDRHDHDHPPGTEVTDVYVFHHDFDRPGIWEAAVSFDGGGGVASFQIAESSESPVVGDRAVTAESPTVQDPRGVDPLCTRDPVCDMHDITISRALEANKPAVIVFATPRFCTSRTCGPIVDFVQHAKDRVGDAASFVHVEIWRDDDASVNKPPDGWVEAYADWKFGGTEPWIYFVSSDGVVEDRWLGAVGDDELAKAVDALISG